MLVLAMVAAFASDPLFTDYLTSETSRVTPAGVTRVDLGVQGTTLAPDHLGPTGFVAARHGFGSGELSAAASYYYNNLATTAAATSVQSAAIGWKQALGAWGPGRVAVLVRGGLTLNAGVPSGSAIVAAPWDWGSERTFLTLEPYARYRGAGTLQPVTPGLALGGIYTPLEALSLEAQVYVESATYRTTSDANGPPSTSMTITEGGEIGASWRFQPSWSLDLNLGAGLDDLGHASLGLYGLGLRHAW